MTNRNKPGTCEQAFCWAAGLTFLVTGLLKLDGLRTPAWLIYQVDPLFYSVSSRKLIAVIAALEVGVGLATFLPIDTRPKFAALAWFSSMLLLYKLGLKASGQITPCNCLGRFAGPFSQQTVELLTSVMATLTLTVSLLYLLTRHSLARQATDTKSRPRL